MGELNNNLFDNILALILAITVFFLAMIYFFSILDHNKEYLNRINICENNGYDSYDNRMRVNNGYIACCKDEYVDNIFYKQNCTAIKYVSDKK
jgi:hypothetical protein